jgi:hypothetical protein
MATTTPTLADAAAVELTFAYLSELDRLGDLVGAAIREVFDNMSGYDRRELAMYVEQVRPLAVAGAAEGADLASAYLAELTGSVPPAIDLRFAPEGLEGPYHRMWHDLGENYGFEHSRDAGSEMSHMSGIDSTRGGASKRMAKPGTKVIGFRRVLHAGACDWCQVVSTQIYKSVESGSFGHHGCRCRPPVPVTDRNDPALAINRKLRSQLRKSGAMGRASAARTRSRAR